MPDTKQNRADSGAARLWSYFAALAVAAFSLNWVWEMAQMSAFVEMAGRTWRETAQTCTIATFGDVAMTFAVYGVACLAARQLRWGYSGRWNTYATAALLGGGCAAAFEWFALATGRWTYNEHMPIVPGLKVGLWPLLQLTLLTPVSLWIALRLTKQRGKARF